MELKKIDELIKAVMELEKQDEDDRLSGCEVELKNVRKHYEAKAKYDFGLVPESNTLIEWDVDGIKAYFEKWSEDEVRNFGAKAPFSIGTEVVQIVITEPYALFGKVYAPELFDAFLEEVKTLFKPDVVGDFAKYYMSLFWKPERAKAVLAGIGILLKKNKKLYEINRSKKRIETLNEQVEETEKELKEEMEKGQR